MAEKGQISDETRRKLSEAGKRAWAEGKRCRTMSEETKAKVSRNRKGKCLGNQNGFKKGHTPHNKGKRHPVHTAEWRAKASAAHSGENHWNWKGGITYQNRMGRNSAKHKEWAKAVYRRDRWTCQVCKKHCQCKDIVAHHLVLWSECEETRYLVENGITLCRSCHCSIHSPRAGTGESFKKNGVNSGELSRETILSQADGETRRKVQRLMAEAKSHVGYASNADTSALAERHDIV